MNGSVRKKGATWSFRIDLGRIDNKRKQIERSGFKTESEANKALASTLNDMNQNGEFIEVKKITFQEVFEEFINNEAPSTRRFSTIVRYKSLYKNHFLQDIAQRYIGTISSEYLQNFINTKNESLSDEFVRSLYNFLLVLFGYAIKKKYLKKSPMDNVKAPMSYRAYGEIKVYSIEELKKMEERFVKTNLYTAYKLGVNLGVRVGECFALRFSDIDWDKNTIRIDKQLQFQNKIWSFILPKSSNSMRTITLHKSLVDYLIQLQDRYNNEKYIYQDGYQINTVKDCRFKTNKLIVVDDFINRKQNGDMLKTTSDKVLSRIAKDELGINFKFHNLRHTHATRLAEAGVNPKYIQERLGHGKIEITLRYYTHITDKMHDQVADIVDEL